MGLSHFFSFLNLHTVGKTPWTGDQPDERPLPTHITHTEWAHTDNHVSSGIRTHNPILPADEDSPCLKPRGHRDKLSC
jgi:hypothetical protein